MKPKYSLDHLAEDEIEALKACNAIRNYEQLEALCRDIKQRRGGGYPRDWYDRVMRTGMIADALANWNDGKPGGTEF